MDPWWELESFNFSLCMFCPIPNKMLVFIVGVNQDVIKIHSHKLPNEKGEAFEF